MANKVTSNNILVFPSTTRSTGFGYGGQFMTEYNLVNVINRLVDKAAFVITKNDGEGSSFSLDPGAPFELNMYGYYFRIDREALKTAIENTTSRYINASIGLKLDPSSGMIEILPVLNAPSIDSANQYNGLILEESDTYQSSPSVDSITQELWVPSSDEDTETLWSKPSTALRFTILEKRDNSWSIPDKSRITLSPESKVVSKIDDGRLYTSGIVSFSLSPYDGGVVAPDSQEIRENTIIVLPFTAAIRANYTFEGWKKAGSETIYAAGSKYEIEIPENIIFSAEWKAGTPMASKYTVTFSLGDGVEGDTPASIELSREGKIILPEASRDGYILIGWKEGDGDGPTYGAGSKYVVEESVTLTAVWNEALTVTFNTDGGSLVDVSGNPLTSNTVKVLPNSTLEVIPTAKKDGYNFLGWYNNDKQLTASTTIEADVTYTAKWEAQAPAPSAV